MKYKKNLQILLEIFLILFSFILIKLIVEINIIIIKGIQIEIPIGICSFFPSSKKKT